MRRMVFACVLAAVVGGVTGAASPAYAHFLGYSSVDSGEIRWGDSTSWDDARSHANSTWNGLDPINIAADDWTTYEDVTWRDANDSGVGWDGLYSNSAGTDDIYLNSYYLNGYTTAQRRAVAAHELGHALGLAHSYSDQLMNSCSTCSGYNTPQSHDISDYHSLWGY